MKMLFELPALEFTEIDTGSFTGRNIKLLVARLDKIHPVVSGNKLFKLHFFLEEAVELDYKTILTFGGAYSNHLLATAYSCNIAGLKSIGIVRGEKPLTLSHTLQECEKLGMQLKFISRENYKDKELPGFENEFYDEYGKCFIIPEGGYHPLGVKGAALIMDQLFTLTSTHICTAVGTATTLAGLLQNTKNGESVIGIPVLKVINDIQQRLSFLNNGIKSVDPVLFKDYHFGGYAKKTNVLIEFMNELYTKYNLPTDFIYTAKMMYAVTDKIRTGFFQEDSVVICLHTGGLQGNRSLPAGTLVF